ncbi:LCP family protein [Euzebya sp.]|uniref:LCP family protein n=1 Tax=Euzebya sp. TaxID=1971409 RepID=UPI003512ED6C
MDLLDPPAPPPPTTDRPRHRRAAGRRSAHLARSRRTRRRTRWLRRARRTGLVLALAVAIGLVVWAVLLLTGGDETAEAPADGQVTPAGPVPQQVIAWVRTAEPGGPAIGLTLLAAGEDGSANATFVPSTTLVEIPGVGMDRVGLAHQYGGHALTAATLSNAIGIEIAGSVALDQPALGTLLQRIGGAEVDVPERLVARAADGSGTVAFEPGPQFLNGVRLAAFWAFAERGESELDTFPRQQRALDAMLRAVADADPAAVADALDPHRADLDRTVLSDVIGTAARAAVDGRMTYQLLPVEPLGSADQGLGASFQLLTEEVAALVDAELPGAVPAAGATGPLSLQVLNGVGTPGIGQQVDERLQGMGLRIVRTENARSFDFLETQILIYDETPELLDAARQVQSALGVGTIRVSRQPQSVVDLTVVVGGDFIGRGSSAPAGL